MLKHPSLSSIRLSRAVWAQNNMTPNFWLLDRGRERAAGEGSMGAQGQTSRMGVWGSFHGQDRFLCPAVPELQLRGWGSRFLSLGKVAPPKSHKSCMKAAASSLHHTEAGYSSPLCTRMPLPLKIAPQPEPAPPAPQPHGNQQEWQAETLSSISITSLLEKLKSEAGSQGQNPGGQAP